MLVRYQVRDWSTLRRLAAQLYTQLATQQVLAVLVVVHDYKTQLALHIAARGCDMMALVMASHAVVRDYGKMALATACSRTNDN
jgi:hypothetical protein